MAQPLEKKCRQLNTFDEVHGQLPIFLGEESATLLRHAKGSVIRWRYLAMEFFKKEVKTWLNECECLS